MNLVKTLNTHMSMNHENNKTDSSEVINGHHIKQARLLRELIETGLLAQMEEIDKRTQSRRTLTRTTAAQYTPYGLKTPNQA